MLKKRALFILTFVHWIAGLAYGQGSAITPVSDDLLQNPPPESWLSWRGGPDEERRVFFAS